MRKVNLIKLGLVLCFCGIAFAQPHRWVTLDGPYWANGIDVAYGGFDENDNLAWHRYLIGSDGSETIPFYWGEADDNWKKPPFPSAAFTKAISYRTGVNGQVAFSSVNGDDIWQSTNGGQNWARTFFSYDNRQFTAVEIDPAAVGTKIFVGCDDLTDEASVYNGELISGNWVWNPVGDGREGYEIRDLEYSVEHQELVVGTDNGLWRYRTLTNWVPVAGGLTDIRVVEALDNQNTFWAATGGDLNERKLFYTADSWDNFVEVEVQSQSFDKEVNDIAAIMVEAQPGYYQSVYLATEDGLYMLNVFGVGSNISIPQFVDFKTDPEFSVSSPFRYDTQIKSIDYYQYSNQIDRRHILVGTASNVFLIEEIRDLESGLVSEFLFTDISKGTYRAEIPAPSFPIRQENEQIFSLTQNGIIKSQEGLGQWEFSGMAYSDLLSPAVGKDIVTHLTGQTDQDYILAASRIASNGTIMYSKDLGKSWIETSPTSKPPINAVELSPVNNLAYAAGEYEHILLSSNCGLTWRDEGTFSSPDFHDVVADPCVDLADRFYACGAGDDKCVRFNGSTWAIIEYGLNGVSAVNQLARNRGDSAMYAATDLGIFKINNITIEDQPIWHAKNYGIGAGEIGSIIINPNNNFSLLASTAPDINPATIYASGDSGRSWVHVDMGEIEDAEARVHKLAASQDTETGFISGTDKGVFYLDNIFKAGVISTEETWGPGTIIVQGDVLVNSQGTLNVVGPCTVYVEYYFDINSGDYNPTPGKSEIIIAGGTLNVLGGPDAPVVFTSSRPTNKAAGDWTGILLDKGGNGVTINLNYCTIEYADYGIYDLDDASHLRFFTNNCKFLNNRYSGIDIFRSSSGENTFISNSHFRNCANYGIKIRSDDNINLWPIWISDNEFIDCAYGIWYSGNSDLAGSRYFNIADNIIRRTIPNTGVYGIYISKFNSGGAPKVFITGDSVVYFNQGGLCLSSVSANSVLTGNKIKRNYTRGLYLLSSAPQILGTGEEDYNAFTYSQIGIRFDRASGGKVRYAKIKENSAYGVLVESHDGGPPTPDFGISSNWGKNSINTQNPPGSYYDMRNMGITADYKLRNLRPVA